MYLSLVAAFAQNLILIIFKDLIISIFTTIPTITVFITSAWWIFNIFVIFDTTQGIAAAAMRASGLQKVGSIVTFVAYWVIGIPLTLLSVFAFDLSNTGIWLGPTLACMFNTAAYLYIFK